MLRSAWIIFAATVMTFLCSIVAIFSGLVSPYSKFSNGVIRFWAKSLLYVSGIKLEIVGRNNLKTGQPYVYIVNHQGLFDIMACVVSMPGTVRFIAKRELFRIPVFAQAMRLVGMIEVDRGNSERAKKSLDKAAAKIRDGVSVIVFPEGTRSRDGNIQRFKKGGFILALKAKIPLAPTVISGSLNIMKKKSLELHEGCIKVEFLEPIPVEQRSYDDRDELVNETRQKIIEHFDPHYGKE